MNCCVRRQVEVGGSYEPLGVAGLILIDRNILDLGPMLQKDLHRDNLPEVSAPNGKLLGDCSQEDCGNG
jgi:hypothetical protein